MITTQLFKTNDERDQKILAAVQPIMALIGSGRDDFYDGAWEAFPLGDMLYELNRDPMVGAITQETFRTSFFAIHELFTRPGTFEFYLSVFRAVWGVDVDVEFTVPNPGELLINIEAVTIQNDDFLARRIVDNQYVFDEVLDDEGDNIALQGVQGVKTQNETDALIFELAPAGIWTQATLVVG